VHFRCILGIARVWLLPIKLQVLFLLLTILEGKTTSRARAARPSNVTVDYLTFRPPPTQRLIGHDAIVEHD
jgi:hypothetical protein